MTIYTPYTYLIGWTNHNKYYYGVRYAIDCHPDDFWVEYFASSDYVDEHRELHGEPDIIQIRRTFTDRESAILWEHKVNKRMDVVNDNKWLNKACWPAVDNRGRTRSEETRRKMSKPRSDEHRQNISKAMTGRTHSAETRRRISESNTGKTRSEETRRNMSKGHIGKALSAEHRLNISKGMRKRKTS